MVQKMPKLAFSCKNCSFGFKTGDKDDIGKTYWIYTEDEVQCTDVYEQNMFLQLGHPLLRPIMSREKCS